LPLGERQHGLRRNRGPAERERARIVLGRGPVVLAPFSPSGDAFRDAIARRVTKSETARKEEVMLG
jgi:hypothetical protein